MITLMIRTDKPESELYVYENNSKLAQIKWQAHLKLAETLNSKIEELLKSLNISYSDLSAIAIYKGPGSFTGLRIGVSVANALAYALNIPIVARGGDNWRESSLVDLHSSQTDKMAQPEYGSAAHTTKPRK